MTIKVSQRRYIITKSYFYKKIKNSQQNKKFTTNIYKIIKKIYKLFYKKNGHFGKDF